MCPGSISLLLSLFFSLSSLLLVICEEKEKGGERERERERISYRHNEAPIIKSLVLLERFGRNEFNDSKKGY
jgi:hypothetical protein